MHDAARRRPEKKPSIRELLLYSLSQCLEVISVSIDIANVSVFTQSSPVLELTLCAYHIARAALTRHRFGYAGVFVCDYPAQMLR